MEETTNSQMNQPSSGGMNWKVIGGVIAAVVVIGVIVFGMGGKSDAPSDEAMSGSLKSLLAIEGSKKCSVSSKTETSESSGEVMVSGGMMRGMFTSTANGQTMTSNMIVKENTSYVWTDAMEQGIKFSLETAPTAGENPNQQAVDVNQEYSYDCEDWTEDASAFELPSTVTFVDLAAMMNGQIPENMMPSGTN